MVFSREQDMTPSYGTFQNQTQSIESDSESEYENYQPSEKTKLMMEKYYSKRTQHRKHELEHIMKQYYFKENEAYASVNRSLRRDIQKERRRADRIWDELREIHRDYELLFQVCHDIFLNNEDIRNEYSNDLVFADLPPTVMEEDIDYIQVEEPLRVRRRLEY